MSDDNAPSARTRKTVPIPIAARLLLLAFAALLLWFLLRGGGPRVSRAAVVAPETDHLSAELNAVVVTGATLVGTADGDVAILEYPAGAEGDAIRQNIERLGEQRMPEGDTIQAIGALIAIYEAGALPPVLPKEVAGLRVVHRSESGSFLTLEAPSDGVTPSLVEALLDTPGVDYLEPDAVVGLPLRVEDDCGAIKIKDASACPGGCSSTGRPNDPDILKQWGYDSVRAHCVRGLEYERRVVVALLDSGVTLDHPDLVGRWWVNPGEKPGNGIDDDGNGRIDDVHGWDFVEGDPEPQDPYGHGTRMAGVIAAAVDDTTGIAGVAVSVEVMPLRWAADSSYASVTLLADAIDYAIEEQADIMNMSFGFGSKRRAFRQALARAQAAGLLTVCAGGNDMSDVDRRPCYPACYALPSVLSVCAIDRREQLWVALPGLGSSWGAHSIDLAAPGSCIWTTVNSGKWDWDMGTSVATAHVSAAAAVVWGTQTFSASTYGGVRSELLAHVRTLQALAGKCATGGTVDLGFLCP